jgi:hypothetical protein
MAVVRLSDVYIADVYGSYTAVNSPETSSFFTSGIIARNEQMDEIARAGGKVATVPFWQDLDANLEPNYSNDDPADLAVANKVGTATMSARKAWVNQGFGEMDLVTELAGTSPMQHIRNRFGTYWTRQLQRRMIAMTIGVLADNVANDGGDMLIDISGLAGDAAVFNSGAFIAAAYTAGENAEMFRGIAVHSMIMARMVENDEIIMIPDSAGGLTIPTYKGRRVIVDDQMPVSGGVYTSVLFGGGAIGFGGVEGNAFAIGEGVPKVPFEMWRDPHPGNGGGTEEIWERNTWLLHPFGYQWIEGSLAEMSPTLNDLKSATHWNRVVDRKQVPLAFIKSRATPA